ncbi:MAG: VWA domain-containing protein [Bryobacteraceae bacterium]
MFFLNLSMMEFMALFGAASALVVTLYLLNRSRRKQKVATLRFWVSTEQPTVQKHRRKIQQPLSLILQLISIALLLLAIAQLRLGSREKSGRDHVLILDTSSWTAARTRGGTLLDQGKSAAQAYVRALPSSDRVMLVRADGLATPATGLESNRQIIEEAIRESRPGAAALNLEQALAFATQVEKLHASSAGEIVYAGTGRVLESDGALQATSVANFRVLPIKDVVENCGLRKIGLRRSIADPGLWEVFLSVRNYGTVARSVPVGLQFGGAIVGSRRLQLAPGKDEEATFTFRTRAAGWLEVRLLIDDALAEDNRAILELPSQKPLKVDVYTDEPELLRPVLAANALVEASYISPSKYKADGDARITILDRFHPAQLPKGGILWIAPPAQGSPVAVHTTVTNAPVVRWKSDHDLGAGLRTKQWKLESSEVFAPAAGDISVAEVEGGPVILARPSPARLVVLGFHPGKSAMRFDLTTPLLFANILRWMDPAAFRRWEVYGGTAGTVTVPLESGVEAADVKVISSNQQNLPFTINGHSLRFFSGTPGTVRVITADREQVYSLTLPEVGEAVWQPPLSARRGTPLRVMEASARDLWPALAVLGGLGLLMEWLLFGRTRMHLAGVEHPVADRPLRRAS